MRITHVVGTTNFAGVERYVVDVAKRQSELGHEVQVFGGAATAMTALLAGTDVIWRPHAPAGALVWQIVRQGRRDVLHSHITAADFCAAAARPFTLARHVSTRHITAARGYRPATRVLGRVLRRTLSREISVSSWTNTHLERLADTVVLNGVPKQDDTPGAREPVVLMAQRLAPEKDTDVGLEAWAHSGLADRGWRLKVAGRGELQADLEAQAKSLGVEASVDFLGWVGAVSELMQSASLFLAPAPEEPCGLSVLEAMSWGLPVVAAGSGGHLETIGSVPGAALFPPGDARAAAHHLARLADDDASRLTYGAAVREAQRERFSIEIHVDRLLAAYP